MTKQRLVSLVSILSVIVGIIFAVAQKPVAANLKSCGPQTTLADGYYISSTQTVGFTFCQDNLQPQFIKIRVVQTVVVAIAITPANNSGIDVASTWYDRSANPLGTAYSDTAGPNESETRIEVLQPGYHAFEIGSINQVAGAFSVTVTYPDGYISPTEPNLMPTTEVLHEYPEGQPIPLEFTTNGVGFDKYIVVSTDDADISYAINAAKIQFIITHYTVGRKSLRVTTYATPLPNDTHPMPIAEFYREYDYGTPTGGLAFKQYLPGIFR